MSENKNPSTGAAKDERSIERELKFSVDGIEGIRERLVELEAERKSPGAPEDNWIFDRNEELTADGRLLRLRKDGGGAVLTYKGAPTFENGVKIREELETRLGNLDHMRDILLRLGYEPTRRYQKVREEWLLGGVIIALDHTPVGDFVEFEGIGAETVARRCGLAVEDAESRNYLKIYDDMLKENPALPPDMVFQDDN
ncbi:MAG: class IV adenylate cyclase [Acidobacteriota bacterium]